MLRRIAVAAVGIPAAIAIIYLGAWILAAGLALLGAVGAFELYLLARRSGAWPLSGVGIAGAVVLPFIAYWVMTDATASGALLLYGSAGFVMVTTAAAMLRGPMAQPLTAVAITLTGVIYPSGLLAFVLILRHGSDGSSPWGATWLVLLPLAIVWIGDSVAMVAGGMIGGPKLAPVLSPKKTWSGSAAGTLSSVVVAPLFGMLVLSQFAIRLPVWQLVTIGGAVSILSQVGDLAESLFKREAGVKDSGRFFSEHGGVLDRLDALYWGLPAAAFLYHVFGI